MYEYDTMARSFVGTTVVITRRASHELSRRLCRTSHLCSRLLSLGTVTNSVSSRLQPGSGCSDSSPRARPGRVTNPLTEAECRGLPGAALRPSTRQSQTGPAHPGTAECPCHPWAWSRTAPAMDSRPVGMDSPAMGSINQASQPSIKPRLLPLLTCPRVVSMVGHWAC